LTGLRGVSPDADQGHVLRRRGMMMTASSKQRSP
jgi:hypothetical protein